LLEGCFWTLVEDTEGAVVTAGAQGEVVVAIADVDQWCHLEVDGYLSLVLVAGYKIPPRPYVRSWGCVARGRLHISIVSVELEYVPAKQGVDDRTGGLVLAL
jgi:hypothetical protein